MKKTLYLIYFLFLIVFSLSIYAFTDGDILNQSQVNSINTTALNLHALDFRYTGNIKTDSNNVYFELDYLNIQKIDNTTFMIYRENGQIYIPLSVFANCLQNLGACQTRVINTVSPQMNSILTSVKNRIDNYKLSDMLLHLDEWLRGMFQ